jgi:hypothetical protein
MHKIADRRAFAQELGFGDHIEIYLKVAPIKPGADDLLDAEAGLNRDGVFVNDGASPKNSRFHSESVAGMVGIRSLAGLLILMNEVIRFTIFMVELFLGGIWAAIRGGVALV